MVKYNCQCNILNFCTKMRKRLSILWIFIVLYLLCVETYGLDVLKESDSETESLYGGSYTIEMGGAELKEEKEQLPKKKKNCMTRAILNMLTVFPGYFLQAGVSIDSSLFGPTLKRRNLKGGMVTSLITMMLFFEISVAFNAFYFVGTMPFDILLKVIIYASLVNLVSSMAAYFLKRIYYKVEDEFFVDSLITLCGTFQVMAFLHVIFVHAFYTILLTFRYLRLDYNNVNPNDDILHMNYIAAGVSLFFLLLEQLTFFFHRCNFNSLAKGLMFIGSAFPLRTFVNMAQIDTIFGLTILTLLKEVYEINITLPLVSLVIISFVGFLNKMNERQCKTSKEIKINIK